METLKDQVKGVAEGPFGHSVSTWLAVIGFAILGGVVKWVNDYRESSSVWDRKMIFITLVAQIFTSGFVGSMTFLACRYFQLSDTITAVFIGISGHMGAEAINVFKTGFSNFFQRSFGGIEAKQEKGGSNGKAG